MFRTVKSLSKLEALNNTLTNDPHNDETLGIMKVNGSVCRVTRVTKIMFDLFFNRLFTSQSPFRILF